MLEHVPDEAAFASELARVTRPGGLLVVNTPHLKRTLLRRLRHALGQTDEKHGHLRPGYTPERLRELLAPAFALERHRTYSRFFSEAVDTALNWGMERLGKKSSAKGMVVTGDDLARHRKTFRAYSAIYPLVWALTRLDALVPASGYMLIASLRRREGRGQADAELARLTAAPGTLVCSTDHRKANLVSGETLGHFEIPTSSAKAAWACSTAPATRASGGRWPSSCCARRSWPIPSARGASCRRRGPPRP